MKLTSLKRAAIIGTFALTSVLPSTTMAAIPCHELEVIPAPDDMVVPMIYIELPISTSTFLDSSQPVDRTNAEPIADGDGASAESAVQNQIRCMNYGMGSMVMGNSTPEFRVATTARPGIEDVDSYIDAENAHLVQAGDTYTLEDGRTLIEYTALINDDQFYAGEMVFEEFDGELYLDQASLTDEFTLSDMQRIPVSEKFSREVKIVHMTNGEGLYIDNRSEESMADIVIKNPAGETIFEGESMAEGMVGGETQHIFVAHDLEPGDYEATITFEESGVEMSITIQVEESSATPEAATPAS